MLAKTHGLLRRTKAWQVAIVVLAFTRLGIEVRLIQAQPPGPTPAKPPAVKLGLNLNDPERTCQGYTLLAPANSTTTYLLDMDGKVVHTWQSDCKPGHSAYLLENGHLMRAGTLINPPFLVFGGAGGRIQEFSWDGELLWDFTYADASHLGHHDICPLPNGNVLLLVWEQKTREQALAAGRRPETVHNSGLVADSVVEIRPTGKTTGDIVWEWHAWDHLVQDFDSSKSHFGDVGKHPQRIDVNFGENTIGAMVAKPEELKKLQALGYIGSTDRKPSAVSPDWLHINSVAYNAELDQIMFSVHQFSEIWVIDHRTTTKEAAGETGGKSGRGGGLLYRWGNPRAYRAGTVKEQKLFSQHNAHWIPNGYPGAGHILVFNNGMRRTGGAYSSVDEIVPPIDAHGHYAYSSGSAYGPESAVWSYSAPNRIDFYSSFISGAHRLPNGNTFVCSGANGTLFEVTANKELVWKYLNPVLGIPTPWSSIMPKLGQMISPRLHTELELTPPQRQELESLDTKIAKQIDAIFNEDQKRLAAEFGSGRDNAPPSIGQIVPASFRGQLKLTDSQQTQLDLVQKEAEFQLDKILDEKQKNKIKMIKEKGPPSPPLPPGGFGPPGGGGIFRATRYPSDYAGLKGRELKPGSTVEELNSQ